MNFQSFLDRDYILLDGAMGTMLQKKGMAPGTVPETLNILNPSWIEQIHKSYVDAGAMAVYANTFGVNRYKMEKTGYSVSELAGAGIACARRACEGTDCLVALDIGPSGRLMEPTGDMTFDEAYELFREVVAAGKDADFIVIETMTDLLEAKAAVLAAKENSSLPVFCTMTFEANGRTFTGCSVPSMTLTLSGLGVSAIGVNCSLGPVELLPVINELCKWTNLPIIVKPNAGLPDPVTDLYDIEPPEFTAAMSEMADLGVKVFGGCCGTTPEYIAALKEMLDRKEKSKTFGKRPKVCVSAVCSASSAVLLNRPRVIGERLNPTGKKRLKEALLSRDMDYILRQAAEQIEAGADILDINTGLPGIDEKEMMRDTVKALQGVADVPLQIDSTKPEVIEAALRVCAGRPIVNSVNGSEKSLSEILPLIKKYGAAVIGLTLDEKGIPGTAKERVAIAERILSRAADYGILKEDVYIDCLTQTVSAEQDAAMETLKALRYVKESMGLKTVLGVSNISFGLPDREFVNSTFLSMALASGLDLAIMNPNSDAMMRAFKAHDVLAGYDRNAMEFIEYSRNNPFIKNGAATGGKTDGSRKTDINKALDSGVSRGDDTAGASGAPDTRNMADSPDNGKFLMPDSVLENSADGIYKAMERGLKSEGRKITAKLLETTDAMSIINETLIPSLDRIGERFESGAIFLPQLILAADVAKECFDEIKTHLARTGHTAQSKGKIILATVKGDIHDIGKNIVKVILENYGYDVIDLGRDVDPGRIVEEAKKLDIKLAGLSALMTTTLGAMEETIRLLHEQCPDCKVMAGGAVLTKDYAMKIGADYYARDAKESADIAKLVLG